MIVDPVWGRLEVRSEIKKSTVPCSEAHISRRSFTLVPVMVKTADVCQAELRAEHNVTPGLAVILVGSRKDSQSYAARLESCLRNWSDDYDVKSG